MSCDDACSSLVSHRRSATCAPLATWKLRCTSRIVGFRCAIRVLIIAVWLSRCAYCCAQLPQYRNTAHALWHIVTTEGVKRLYIGLSINYIKVGPAHAVSFVIYEFCKSKLNIK